MRLKQAMLLSHGLFLAVGVAGVLAFLVVVSHYGNLGRPWELLLWVGGGLLIFAGIWSIFEVAHAISEPLEQIAAASRAIAAGRFDVRAGRARYREGTTLAASFNDMAEALGAFHQADVARLLSEQRRNEVVLDSIDDGIVILDEDARIERINPIAARQFGIDPSRAAGNSLDEALGRSDFDAYARLCIEQQNPGQRLPLEISLGEGAFQRNLNCSFGPFTDARPGLVLVVRGAALRARAQRIRDARLARTAHAADGHADGGGSAG